MNNFGLSTTYNIQSMIAFKLLMRIYLCNCNKSMEVVKLFYTPVMQEKKGHFTYEGQNRKGKKCW